jgi:hypothetical protein
MEIKRASAPDVVIITIVLLITFFLFGPCAARAQEINSCQACAQVAPPRPPTFAQTVRVIERIIGHRNTGMEPQLRHDISLTLVREARRAHLDPFLVLAVMRVESAYDPDAVSPKGAIGLMQVMPQTFARVMGPDHLITDPIDNVRAGVRYLGFLRRVFGDDQEKMIMGYWAGDKILRRMLRENGVPGHLIEYMRSIREQHDKLAAQASP